VVKDHYREETLTCHYPDRKEALPLLVKLKDEEKILQHAAGHMADTEGIQKNHHLVFRFQKL
jgi:hypothetical protein